MGHPNHSTYKQLVLLSSSRSRYALQEFWRPSLITLKSLYFRTGYNYPHKLNPGRNSEGNIPIQVVPGVWTTCPPQPEQAPRRAATNFTATCSPAQLCTTPRAFPRTSQTAFYECTVNGDIHRCFLDLHLLPQIGQVQSLNQLMTRQGNGRQFPAGAKSRIGAQGSAAAAQAEAAKGRRNQGEFRAQAGIAGPDGREDSSPAQAADAKFATSQGFIIDPNADAQAGQLAEASAASRRAGGPGQPGDEAQRQAPKAQGFRATWKQGQIGAASGTEEPGQPGSSTEGETSGKRFGETRGSNRGHNRRARPAETRDHAPAGAGRSGPRGNSRKDHRRYRTAADGATRSRSIGTAERMREPGQPGAPSPAKPDRCGRRGNPNGQIGGVRTGSSGATRGRPTVQPGIRRGEATQRAAQPAQPMDWPCGAIRGAVAGAAQASAVRGNPETRRGPSRMRQPGGNPQLHQEAEGGDA